MSAKSHTIVILPMLAAAALWFFMFSPWIRTGLNFWVMMAGSAVILTAFSLFLGRGWREALRMDHPLQQILLGIALAAVLWGVFWAGDKLSQLMFGFARPQVDSIYGLKAGRQPLLLALLLLVLIGPAEELFWRGFVQRTLSNLRSPLWGFIITTLIYTLIHIWALNFMLIMAALVCGVVWGFLYWVRPQWLPALILSHALWDACVFVVFPI